MRIWIAGPALVGGMLGAVVVSGCANQPGGSARASVQACTAFGISAIETHTTVTSVPAACRGLNRAQVNFAMGRAVFEVAGSGQRKAVWRRQAALEGTHLARLITSLPQRPAATAGARTPPLSASPVMTQVHVLGVITLFSWLVSASSGAFMLGTWIAKGGPRQQRRTREGLPPGVIFSHFGLAATGLLLWISYLVTGVAPLSWTAAGLLVPAVGLGISTLTLWTPYPVHGAPPGEDAAAGSPGRHAGSMLGTPAEDAIARRVTDEVFASALNDDEIARRLTEEVLASAQSDPSRAGRRPKGHLAALVPAVHGMAAITTILFALLTVVSSAR